MKKQKEKKERIEKAKRKKQELLDRLARRGEIVIMREGKDIEWIRRKQSQWRKYREKENISIEEENVLRNKMIEKIPERRPRTESAQFLALPSTPLAGVEKGTLELKRWGLFCPNLERKSPFPEKKSPEKPMRTMMKPPKLIPNCEKMADYNIKKCHNKPNFEKIWLDEKKKSPEGLNCRSS